MAKNIVQEALKFAFASQNTSGKAIKEVGLLLQSYSQSPRYRWLATVTFFNFQVKTWLTIIYYLAIF